PILEPRSGPASVFCLVPAACRGQARPAARPEGAGRLPPAAGATEAAPEWVSGSRGPWRGPPQCAGLPVLLLLILRVVQEIADRRYWLPRALASPRTGSAARRPEPRLRWPEGQGRAKKP